MLKLVKSFVTGLEYRCIVFYAVTKQYRKFERKLIRINFRSTNRTRNLANDIIIVEINIVEKR